MKRNNNANSSNNMQEATNNQKTSSRNRQSNKSKSSNGKRRSDQRRSNETCKSTNDPKWYTSNTTLADAATRLPFVWPLGQRLQFDTTRFVKVQTDSSIPKASWYHDSFYVPGICAVHLAPTLGYQDTPHSPLNVAATTEYAFVRHVNSGSRNYDAVDLMKYNVAMASIYSLLGFLMRAYGVARTYSGVHRYMPETLLQAMRISDGQTLGKKLMAMEYEINILIQKVSTLAVPNNMPYFQRAAFLYSNIYAESESALSQLYLFVPDGYYKWVDTNATSLSYNKVTASKTWDEWIDIVSDLIDNVYRSEDCGIMSGDILHAYGDNIIKLQPLPATYETPIIHDTAVLNQIRNATICDIENNDITVNMEDKTAPFLRCAPRFKKSLQAALGANRPGMIFYNEGDNTDGFLFEATRLHAISDKDGFALSGSEIVTKVQTWLQPYYAGTTPSYAKYTEPTDVQPYTDLELADSGSGMFTTHFSVLSTLMLQRSFNYCPVTCLYTHQKGGSDTRLLRAFITDIDNYQYLGHDEIIKLHETANISLFNVPIIGKF